MIGKFELYDEEDFEADAFEYFIKSMNELFTLMNYKDQNVQIIFNLQKFREVPYPYLKLQFASSDFINGIIKTADQFGYAKISKLSAKFEEYDCEFYRPLLINALKRILKIEDPAFKLGEVRKYGGNSYGVYGHNEKHVFIIYGLCGMDNIAINYDNYMTILHTDPNLENCGYVLPIVLPYEDKLVFCCYYDFSNEWKKHSKMYFPEMMPHRDGKEEDKISYCIQCTYLPFKGQQAESKMVEDLTKGMKGLMK